MRAHLTGVLILALLLMLSACARTPERAQAATPQFVPLPAGNIAIPGAATGTLGGAAFRFEVPADWNGELVMYLHGYEPRGVPRPLPLLQDDFDRWLLSKGFAVARSAYRTQGWAVAEAMEDNERLRQHMLRQLPNIQRTWLIGHSMGAHLALATLEAHGEAYAGGLALCGANGPAEELMRDGVLAPLVVADALLPGLFGDYPAGLADRGAPPAVDGEAIERALLRHPVVARQLSTAFDIRSDDLGFALMLRYHILRELIDRSGGFPIDNREIRYAERVGVPDIDARVRRYSADAVAAAYVRTHFDLQGKPDAPVLILSNRYDPTVPAPFSGRYALLAQAAGRAERVYTLPPEGEGHCNFEQDAVDRAFQTLLNWARP